MLTARRGKYIFRSLSYCVFESVVRRRIAGVKRYYDIYLLIVKNVSANVADDEFQRLFIAVFFRYFVALGNDVFFEIVTDDIYFLSFYYGKIIVDDERKIRFPRTEIENGYLVKT